MEVANNKPSEAETSDDEMAASRVLDESNASDVFNISARQKIDVLSESLPNSPASFSQYVSRCPLVTITWKCRILTAGGEMSGFY